LIVEHEQGGAKRAAYGEAVLEELSRRLTAEFGRGFDERNLRYMRQFYFAFPMDRAPVPEFRVDEKRKRAACRIGQGGETERSAFRIGSGTRATTCSSASCWSISRSAS
jgi:hypothetical protein